MEIRFKVDDSFFKEISEKLQGDNGPVTGSAVTQNALALFKWAVDEASNGRRIVSINPDGSKPMEVVTPMLKLSIKHKTA